MAEFNRSMSAVRVSVEWFFDDVINYFKFLHFKKDLKIGLRDVGKMYIVCALLQNSITCCMEIIPQDTFNCTHQKLMSTSIIKY
jgi:hypothetical protein